MPDGARGWVNWLMNAIGLVSLVLFVIAWFGCAVAWFYGAYHFFVRGGQADRPSHRRKALKGTLTFLGCWAFAAANGLIGTWFGGWQGTAGH
jgi:hypothetical protein